MPPQFSGSRSWSWAGTGAFPAEGREYVTHVCNTCCGQNGIVTKKWPGEMWHSTTTWREKWHVFATSSFFLSGTKFGKMKKNLLLVVPYQFSWHNMQWHNVITTKKINLQMLDITLSFFSIFLFSLLQFFPFLVIYLLTSIIIIIRQRQNARAL